MDLIGELLLGRTQSEGAVELRGYLLVDRGVRTPIPDLYGILVRPQREHHSALEKMGLRVSTQVLLKR